MGARVPVPGVSVQEEWAPAAPAPADSAPAGSAPADRVARDWGPFPRRGGAGAGGSLPGLGGWAPPGPSGWTGTGPGGTMGAGGPGGSATVSAVDQWVTAHGTKGAVERLRDQLGRDVYATPASVG